MDRERIAKYFDKKETLGKVLEECSIEFERIDILGADSFRPNIVDNPEAVKATLNELTGIYMKLKVIASLSETYKKNIETRIKNVYRMNYYKNPDKDDNDKTIKYTDGSATSYASEQVSEYRRVRNLLLSYLDSCDKAIGSCQTLKGLLTAEMMLAKDN